MKRLSKLCSLALVGAALSALASPAQAVETIVITGSSGTFGNDAVGAAGSAETTFTNTFNFLTPLGFDLSNASISTGAAPGDSPMGSPGSNIDFTSVLLNGTAFTLTPTGMFEFGTVANVLLAPGMNNVLTVNGRNTGDGAFAGTLVFSSTSAVPEPGTWAMMLLGFGAVGFSVRRKRATLMQAA